MNKETKIQLLPIEFELLSNTDFILTKNAILQKLKHFFVSVQLTQQAFIEKKMFLLPEEIFKVSPKISRGENYKGLPWLVLDHPRLFEKENVFAIRTMCWWGKFFSVTLHLSGKYKTNFQKQILKNIQSSHQPDLYICIGENEWEHHFETDNYIKTTGLSASELPGIINERSFIKLALRCPIDSLNNVETLLNKNYETLVNLCL